MRAKSGGNLTKIRKKNLSAIMETIYRNGPITRNEVARQLDLTLPTITTTIQSLLEQNILREEEVSGRTKEVTLGRKATYINIIPEAGYVIGVEWGPRTIYACLTNLKGEIEVQDKVRVSPDYEETLKRTVVIIKQIIEKAGFCAGRILGVGLVTPGIIDTEGKVLIRSSVYQWHKEPVSETLEELLGLPVILESHGRARAVALDLFSEIEKPNTYLYYFVQNGISCIPVVYGEPFDGGGFGAGDIGHTIAQVNGPICVCSHRGCLQAVAGELSLVPVVQKLLEEGRAPVLRQMLGEDKKADFEWMAKAVDGGDYDVEQVLAPAIMYLGISIANFINFLNPELVVVDCALMNSEKLKNTIIQVIEEYNVYSRDIPVRYEFQKNDRFSGALGGCAIAIKEYFIHK